MKKVLTEPANSSHLRIAIASDFKKSYATIVLNLTVVDNSGSGQKFINLTGLTPFP
jgi:hypothetical protein